MRTTILVVDDHAMTRAGVLSLCSRIPEYEVVGEVSTGTEAINFCKCNRVDMVVMDLNLPGIGGIDAISELLRQQPETKVVVLSMYDDDASVFGAVRAGARGFVLKSASDLDLFAAFQAIARGGTYFSPSIADRVLARMQRKEQHQQEPTSPLDTLTPREMQVVRLVAQGKTSKEIAQVLDLGAETVRRYRKMAMRKLHASNSAELTRLVIDMGLLGPSS